MQNKASGPITRSQSQPQSRAGSRMAGQDTWDNFAALDNSFKAAGYDYFDPGEATINDGPYYGRRQSQNLIQTPLVSIPSVGTQSQSIDRSDWTFEQFVDESRYPALVVSGVIPNDPQLQSARSTPKSTQSQRSSYSIDHGSDGSELKKSRRVKHKHYSVAQYDKPEKPMVNESKPWVRVNSSTKGLTTRTTKINHYDPQETYTYGLEHPLGNWKGPTTKFRYDKEIKLELSRPTYTINQIREFIYHYPKNVKGAKLTIWIQKAGSDSAKRYVSGTHNQCRFDKCPMRLKMYNRKGTIGVGSFRVAFDERYHKYRDNNDPYHVAAYFHLYCFERFLDFPEICRKFDVRVDQRMLVGEPKAKYALSLAGTVESAPALAFIDACQDRTLENTFPNYPVHSQYRDGEPKPYENTLNYRMHTANLAARARSQLKQFTDRKQTDSQVHVHKGDLELYTSGRAAQRKPKQPKKRKAAEFDEDEPDVEANETPQKRTKTTSETTKQGNQKHPRKKAVPTTRYRRNQKKAKNITSTAQSCKRRKRTKMVEVTDSEATTEFADEPGWPSPPKRQIKFGYWGEGSEDDSSDTDDVVSTAPTTPPSRRIQRPRNPVNYVEPGKNSLFTPEGSRPANQHGEQPQQRSQSQGLGFTGVDFSNQQSAFKPGNYQLQQTYENHDGVATSQTSPQYQNPSDLWATLPSPCRPPCLSNNQQQCVATSGLRPIPDFGQHTFRQNTYNPNFDPNLNNANMDILMQDFDPDSLYWDTRGIWMNPWALSLRTPPTPGMNQFAREPPTPRTPSETLSRPGTGKSPTQSAMRGARSRAGSVACTPRVTFAERIDTNVSPGSGRPGGSGSATASATRRRHSARLSGSPAGTLGSLFEEDCRLWLVDSKNE